MAKDDYIIKNKSLRRDSFDEELDVLTLKTIDISLVTDDEDSFQKRAEIARDLEEAITTYGFFNVTNFGFPVEKITELREMSKEVLEIPYEEKLQFLASAAFKEDEKEDQIGGERGQGFKPKGYWNIKDGVRDSIDHYNFSEPYKDNKSIRYPEVLEKHVQYFKDFFNHIHRVVLPKLLRLCDIILDVPEGTLLTNYFKGYGTANDTSQSHGRIMMYSPYNSDKSSEKTSNTFLRGHSDISAFTFITSQPIFALQIKDVFSGNWRYVSHRENSLVVNIGDAMEFITGGYFKACLHRVVEPPLHQRLLKRLVIIHFINPNLTSELDPELIASKKLDSLGYNKEGKLKEWDKIEFQDWNNAKGKLLGRKDAGSKNLLTIYGRQVERWHLFENEASVN